MVLRQQLLLLVLALGLTLVAAGVPDICDQVKGMGYPCEHHTVVTEDGFQLGNIRIPPKTPGAYPVFLQHGLLDSAITWVMNYLPSQNLGTMLHDAGYDVWMGNSRANIYSMDNAKYSQWGDEYWDRTDMDFMGMFDLPANIDYVLNQTNHSKLTWVGHSQGTWQAFSAFSRTNKAYASKVDLFVALAPVTSVAKQNSVLLSILGDLHVDDFMSIFGRQFLMNSWLIHAISGVCKLRGLNCDNLLAIMCGGGNMTNMNSTQLYTLTKYDPGGTSTQNMIHWGQLVRDKDYSMRDWGIWNKKFYNGSSTVPKYDLTQYAGPPVAVYYGENDFLADPGDVDTMLSLVPKKYVVDVQSMPTYAHLDFVWSLDAGSILYPDVLKKIKKHKSS